MFEPSEQWSQIYFYKFFTQQKITYIKKLFIQANILQRFKYFDGSSPRVLLTHQIIQNLRCVVNESSFRIRSRFRFFFFRSGSGGFRQNAVRPPGLREYLNVIMNHLLGKQPSHGFPDLTVDRPPVGYLNESDQSFPEPPEQPSQIENFSEQSV